MTGARRAGSAGRGTVVVRSVDTQRSVAAGRAMEAAGAELGEKLTPAVGQSILGQLYGTRVVEADDRHGRLHGFVVQHDQVAWADVLEVARMAAPAVQALGHPGPDCAVDPNCGPCRAVRALGRLRSIWMTSGLTEASAGALDAGASEDAAAGAGTGSPAGAARGVSERP